MVSGSFVDYCIHMIDKRVRLLVYHRDWGASFLLSTRSLYRDTHAHESILQTMPLTILDNRHMLHKRNLLHQVSYLRFAWCLTIQDSQPSRPSMRSCVMNSRVYR